VYSDPTPEADSSTVWLSRIDPAASATNSTELRAATSQQAPGAERFVQCAQPRSDRFMRQHRAAAAWGDSGGGADSAAEGERNGHAGRIRAPWSDDENGWGGEAGDWRATVREGSGVKHRVLQIGGQDAVDM
jgi:hypothetical protein